MRPDPRKIAPINELDLRPPRFSDGCEKRGKPGGNSGAGAPTPGLRRRAAHVGSVPNPKCNVLKINRLCVPLMNLSHSPARAPQLEGVQVLRFVAAFLVMGAHSKMVLRDD